MLLPMRNELTNLLPSLRQRQLVREYRFRFGVVAMLFFVMLILAAAVLLVPTYIFLGAIAHTKEIRLADMKSILSSSDEVALSSRLSTLSNDAATLISLSNKPSVSVALRSALAVSRPGIVLSSLSYMPVAGKAKNTLSLSGVAATRDALRNYQLALESAPFTSAADLPVSAYAKDTNIAFTITITLAP